MRNLAGLLSRWRSEWPQFLRSFEYQQRKRPKTLEIHPTDKKTRQQNIEWSFSPTSNAFSSGFLWLWWLKGAFFSGSFYSAFSTNFTFSSRISGIEGRNSGPPATLGISTFSEFVFMRWATGGKEGGNTWNSGVQSSVNKFPFLLNWLWMSFMQSNFGLETARRI